MLRQLFCTQADRGTPERIAAELPISQDLVYLRVAVDEGRVSFSYSLEGKVFHPIGLAFLAQPGVWVGAKIGIFAIGESDSGELGYADFGWIRFTPLP